MATIIVPYTEVEKLVKLCLEAYNVRSGLVINREDIEYKFLQPRAGTQQCIELKDKPGVTPPRNFRARYYIEHYRNIGAISNFRLEEFQGQSLGLGTEAFISYATLPRTFFPTLSKIQGIPVMEDTGDDIEISVEFENAVTFEDNSDISIGFNPTIYNVIQISDDFALNVDINKPAPEALSVQADTIDGTAMAPVDYETVSTSVEWQDRDSESKPVPITLNGEVGYYNWFNMDDETQRMFDGTGTPDPENMALLELQDQNTRIYSPYYEFEGWEDLLGWFKLTSQYLQEKPLYYEFEIVSPGKELKLLFRMAKGKRTFTNPSGESATTEYFGIGIEGNAYSEPSPFFSFVFSQISKTSSWEESTPLLSEETDHLQFPLRIGFLVDPEVGVRINIAGEWVDWYEGLSQDISEAIAFPYFVSEGGNVEDHRHWFTVNGRKANTVHGFEDYDDALIDIKAIVNVNDALHVPAGATLYTGLKYPYANRSFTTVLSDPDNTAITQNTATINLVNKAQFCYNKLVTNHNYTGLMTDSEVIKPSYYPPTIPVIRWNETTVQCGNYLNMPELEHGSDLSISSIDVDAQSLPLIIKPGDTVVYTIRESDTTIVPFILSFDDIGKFYNGTYTKNIDGTRTFTCLFRFYEKSNGKLVLVPVPLTNTDPTNALPPIHLHFTESQGVRYTSSNQFGVGLIIPQIPLQGGSSLVDPMDGLEIYYTLDGQEPTTSSNTVNLADDGPFIILNIEDGVQTVKAFATAPGYVDSPVITGTFGGANILTDYPDMSVSFDDVPFVEQTTSALFYWRTDIDFQAILQRYKITLTPQTETTELKYCFASGVNFHYSSELYDQILINYTAPFDLSAYVIPQEYYDTWNSYELNIISYARDTEISEELGTVWFAAVRNLMFSCISYWFHYSFYGSGQYEIFSYSNAEELDRGELNLEITEQLVNHGGEDGHYRIFNFTYGFNNQIDYDDWRYFELHVGELNGDTTDFAIVFTHNTNEGTRYCFYKRTGELVFTNGDPSVSTSRPWNQNDIIRVQYNLKNTQIRLAINNGLWSSAFGGVPKNTNSNTIGFQASVGSNPDDETDIIGSKISIRQRTAGFTYSLPPDTVPFDNLPESLL